uniref:hypothetical protein n=1 Tax=Staphylococcus saprophyticus TaxID=29385 RepID=UPI0037037D19
MLLPSIHTHSTHHIHTIDQLTQPIHLPSYPQQNPLPHYQNQAHQLFHTIIQNIQQHLTNYIFKSVFSVQDHLQRHKTT